MGVAALWVLTLGLLAFRSSNPVVLNRIQIMNAKAIAEGTYLAGDVPKLVVTRVWKGPLTAGSRIPVSNLPKPGQLEQAILVPLSISPQTGEYSVTSGEYWNPPEHDPQVPAKPAFIQPTIYPATATIAAELERLLQQIALP